jgi:hypothetical protein
MTVRTAVAASIAALSLATPLLAAACDADRRPVAAVAVSPSPEVSFAIRLPVAPPPGAWAPPPAAWAAPPTAWSPPPAWSLRSIRAACVARFGPDAWRVARCESRALALRPAPAPRWAAAYPRGHGYGHGRGHGHDGHDD